MLGEAITLYGDGIAYLVKLWALTAPRLWLSRRRAWLRRIRSGSGFYHCEALNTRVARGFHRLSLDHEQRRQAKFKLGDGVQEPPSCGFFCVGLNPKG